MVVSCTWVRGVALASAVAVSGCSSQSDTEETGLLPTPRADGGSLDAASPADAAALVDAAGPAPVVDAAAPSDAGSPRDASVVTDAAVPFEAGPLTDAGTIAWNISASQADPPGTRLSFFCGANPSQSGTSSVWGTDVYSYDSSICKAGVHAGKITFAAGGAVRIEMRGDAASFAGSTRNGVTSESWSGASKSFVFLP